MQPTHIRRYKPQPPIVSIYMSSASPEPTEKFEPGQTICKACKSTALVFSAYLDDAKCSDCRQWQNESLSPH